MRSIGLLAGIVCIVVIMSDAFEALVLPRRVTRRWRPTRLFYRTTWRLWIAIAGRLRPEARETYPSSSARSRCWGYSEAPENWRTTAWGTGGSDRPAG